MPKGRVALHALLGTSQAMRELESAIELVGRADRHALIAGEVGVGKSRVGEIMHQSSSRCEMPFLWVNGAELADAQLLRSGTIYVDDVETAPPDMQQHLLALLDTHAIIAATECDLATEVTEGRFNEGLYYRLGMRPLHLPPLRARAGGDVEHIVLEHLALLRRGLPQSAAMLTERAMDALTRYHWPGNVRELRNTLERALLLARGAERIDIMHLPSEVLDASDDVLHVHSGQPLAEVERLHIQRTLRAHGANRTRAARELGISRATLIKKIREYEVADGRAMSNEAQETA